PGDCRPGAALFGARALRSESRALVGLRGLGSRRRDVLRGRYRVRPALPGDPGAPRPAPARSAADRSVPAGVVHVSGAHVAGRSAGRARRSRGRGERGDPLRHVSPGRRRRARTVGTDRSVAAKPKRVAAPVLDARAGGGARRPFHRGVAKRGDSGLTRFEASELTHISAETGPGSTPARSRKTGARGPRRSSSTPGTSRRERRRSPSGFRAPRPDSRPAAAPRRRAYGARRPE